MILTGRAVRIHWTTATKEPSQLFRVIVYPRTRKSAGDQSIDITNWQYVIQSINLKIQSYGSMHETRHSSGGHTLIFAEEPPVHSRMSIRDSSRRCDNGVRRAPSWLAFSMPISINLLFLLSRSLTQCDGQVPKGIIFKFKADCKS
jgi:hypothetical protein